MTVEGTYEINDYKRSIVIKGYELISLKKSCSLYYIGYFALCKTFSYILRENCS